MGSLFNRLTFKEDSKELLHHTPRTRHVIVLSLFSAVYESLALKKKCSTTLYTTRRQYKTSYQ